MKSYRKWAKPTTSKYFGVTLHRRTGRWIAQITVDHSHIYLGMFGLEEDAAKAYDAAALKYFGVQARTNFRSEEPEQ